MKVSVPDQQKISLKFPGFVMLHTKIFKSSEFQNKNFITESEITTYELLNKL